MKKQLVIFTSKFDVRRSTFDVRVSPHRRGFSFAEVMFAVVILGIGFIMVAAVFPVAIQQTQSTGEENIAAALARQAANTVGQLPLTLHNPAYDSTAASGTPASVATELLFPPTVKNYIKGTDAYAVAPPAIVVPFTGNQWDLVKSNLILPSDPRYAYVLFYKRENNSSAAQLIVVAVTIRNRSVYNSADIANYAPSGGSSQITITTTASDLKTLSTAPVGNTVICPDVITGPNTAAVPEGSFVEVPAIQMALASPAGRSYSLGRQINTPGGQGYELNPGGSMELTAGSSGLWGTTVASGTPPVAPVAPITDKAAANSTANVCLTSTLQPTVAYAQLYTTATAPSGIINLDVNAMDYLGLTPGVLNNMTSPPSVAAPGAFVIIGDDYPLSPGNPGPVSGQSAPQDYAIPDSVPGSPGYSVGALNGHIFRLGAAVPGFAGCFYLDPAYGMAQGTGGSVSPDTVPNPKMVPPTGVNPNPPGQGFCAKVYIIGVGRTDPNAANAAFSSYTGSSQDIGVFTSYFQVQ